LVAYHLILIVHLFGLALGMGGASTIDSMFLVACRRKRVTPELVNVIHAAAGLVASAMVLLAVSGGAFFLVGAAPSPKFWAKLIIVGVACLNGLVAHQLIFPLIEQACETGNGSLSFRPWPARLAAATAAISGVSWSAAMILGSWHGLKLGMMPILAAYGVILFGAIVFSACIVAPRVFDINPPERRRSPADLVADLAYQISLTIAESALSFAEHLRIRSDASQLVRPGRYPRAEYAWEAETSITSDTWMWPATSPDVTTANESGFNTWPDAFEWQHDRSGIDSELDNRSHRWDSAPRS
jgi:hypothetical protein